MSTRDFTNSVRNAARGARQLGGSTVRGYEALTDWLLKRREGVRLSFVFFHMFLKFLVGAILLMCCMPIVLFFFWLSCRGTWKLANVIEPFLETGGR